MANTCHTEHSVDMVAAGKRLKASILNIFLIANRKFPLKFVHRYTSTSKVGSTGRPRYY